MFVYLSCENRFFATLQRKRSPLSTKHFFACVDHLHSCFPDGYVVDCSMVETRRISTYRAFLMRHVLQLLVTYESCATYNKTTQKSEIKYFETEATKQKIERDIWCYGCVPLLFTSAAQGGPPAAVQTRTQPTPCAYARLSSPHPFQNNGGLKKNESTFL